MCADRHPSQNQSSPYQGLGHTVSNGPTGTFSVGWRVPILTALDSVFPRLLRRRGDSARPPWNAAIEDTRTVGDLTKAGSFCHIAL